MLRMLLLLGLLPLAAGIGSATAGDLQFTTEISYPTLTEPFEIVAADLNGDGYDDVIVSNYDNVDSSIAVHMNNGDGTFAPFVRYTIGQYLFSVTAADLDNDDTIEVAVSLRGENAVVVMENDGDGNLSESARYTGITQAYAIIAVDLDGNDWPELVTANHEANNICVLWNDGAGAFPSRNFYATGAQSGSVCSGDFDGDSMADLAVVNKNDREVSVFLNNGDSTFAKTDYDLTYTHNPATIRCLDYDNDGDLDLAITCSSILAVLDNDGVGGFALPPNDFSLLQSPAFSPGGINIADMDGDGLQDVITASYVRSFQISFNLATGTLAAATPVGGLYMGYDVRSVIGSDVDGDGDMDAVVTNSDVNTISIHYNQGGGTFPGSIRAKANYRAVGVACGDLNGDGVTDIAISNYQSGGASVCLNNGDSTFQDNVDYRLIDYNDACGTIVCADLDADNDSDLVMTNFGDDSVAVLLNSGSGSFVYAASYPVGSHPWPVAVGDFDGADGPDLAVASSADSTLAILLNAGDGSYGAATMYVTGYEPWCIDVGDIDGDSDLDLAIAAHSSSAVYVHLNDGAADFDNQIDTYTVNYAGSVFFADLDNDTDLDLVTVQRDINRVALMWNDGSGAFTVGDSYATGEHPYAVVAADFTGDGYADIVTSNMVSSSVTFLVNNTDGTFTTGFNFAVGADPQLMDATDIDGDGDIDLAVASYTSSAATVLLNRLDELPVGIDDDNAEGILPQLFILQQNYPNPFNPTTTIKYTLPVRSDVTVDVFNILGRNVRTLVDENQPAGQHTIRWDGRDGAGQSVATGVYLYRIVAGDFVETRKMVLVK